MLALPCLVWVFSTLVLAQRDVLGGLFGGDSSTSLSSEFTHITRLSSGRLTATRSDKSTLTASQSSTAQPTLTPNLSTSTAKFTAVNTALASTSSILPPKESIDHSNKTWQIIGITIIAVLFVATTIACAMFFDRLWRFLKDVLCCTSGHLASEEFILDREKQSWDTRTLSPSPSDWSHPKSESLHEVASMHTVRPRQLPWNTDTRDWHALYRQPSRKHDYPPTA